MRWPADAERATWVAPKVSVGKISGAAFFLRRFGKGVHLTDRSASGTHFEGRGERRAAAVCLVPKDREEHELR